MIEVTREEALATLTPTTAADLVRIEAARVVIARQRKAGLRMAEIIERAGVDELALVIHELHVLEALDPAAADDVRDRCFLRLLKVNPNL